MAYLDRWLAPARLNLEGFTPKFESAPPLKAATYVTSEVGTWLSIKWLEPNAEALALGYSTYYQGADWRSYASFSELADTLRRVA